MSCQAMMKQSWEVLIFHRFHTLLFSLMAALLIKLQPANGKRTTYASGRQLNIY